MYYIHKEIGFAIYIERMYLLPVNKLAILAPYLAFIAIMIIYSVLIIKKRYYISGCSCDSSFFISFNANLSWSSSSSSTPSCLESKCLACVTYL